MKFPVSPALAIDENRPVPVREERSCLHGDRLLKTLRYASHPIGDFPLEMAAYLAFPPGPGPHPALLHLHGGAQSARAEIALAWAGRGFVTLCPDWSVPANQPRAAHATRWPPGTPPVRDATLEAGEATLGHVVRGVRHGLSLLSALPEVRADRIGMVGISWGGFMTWLVNGTDSRLRAAVAAYGCGRAADVEMSDSWRAHFQPETVAATQQAPILHLNGTHDFFGHLQTAEALLAKVGGKGRRLYVPNEDHGLSDAARQAAWAWLDRLLRGEGDVPPEPPVQSGPGRRVYAAGSLDRADVWTEVSSGKLPEAGAVFVTETYADGLQLSSAVRVFAPVPQMPKPQFWEVARQGSDGWFLRWGQENLRLHDLASAELTVTDHGLAFEPGGPEFSAFFRVGGGLLPESTGLELTLFADRGAEVRIRIYGQPEIEEAAAVTLPVQICGTDGRQRVAFPLPAGFSLRPHVLHISVRGPEFSSVTPALLGLAWRKGDG